MTLPQQLSVPAGMQVVCAASNLLIWARSLACCSCPGGTASNVVTYLAQAGGSSNRPCSAAPSWEAVSRIMGEASSTLLCQHSCSCSSFVLSWCYWGRGRRLSACLAHVPASSNTVYFLLLRRRNVVGCHDHGKHAGGSGGHAPADPAASWYLGPCGCTGAADLDIAGEQTSSY